MKLPLRLDVSLLTVLDADSNVVCRADVSQSDRVNAESVRELRELVIARNFTRYLSPDAMAGKGALTLADGLKLSIVPDEHFKPGPLGLVQLTGDGR